VHCFLELLAQCRRSQFNRFSARIGRRACAVGELWEDLRVTLRVSVIGTNYMGATHAAGMAEFGHEVIGVDIDVDRIKTLSAGQSHIF
jgi:hypothetical protein